MLINFFLFLTVMFLCAGLAIDVGMAQTRKLALQHAADAAAIGAGYEKARGNTGWAAAGQTDAALNGFTNGLNGVTITVQSPPTSGAYSGDTSAVQATASQSYQTAFMALLGQSGMATPTTTSVAKMTSTCIYMIGSPSSSYTLLNENYSGFYSYCNIYVGSTAYSIYNDSGSTLNSSLIRTVASSSQASLSGPVSPTPEFNATSHADPLAYVTAPASPASSANCTHTTTSITTTSTIGPGTYCNGLNISGASVILTSGLYIVTGGISWTNGSTVTGSGVTIYLTNGAGYGYGALSITNSTVTLSAPTSSSGGALAGIVMFTDRNWVSSSWPVSINASFVTTDGIWYLPGVGISNYSSTLKGTNYLGLVAYAVFGYAATFRFPSPNYSTLTAGNPFQNPYVGSLVE